MPEGSGSGPGRRPGRTRDARSRPPTRRTGVGHRPRPGREGALRERLRRDPFLFVMCLAALGFITWALALTWWVTGGTLPLIVALVSVAPAMYLFYLRDT